MTAPLDYRPVVLMLGNGLYVAPTLDGPPLNVADLMALYVGSTGAVSYSVVAATKYAAAVGGGPVNPCSPAPLDTDPTTAACKRVPPYNDMVPAPSTVFAQESVLAAMGAATYGTRAQAEASLDASDGPTGFWILETTDGTFVVIEVGIGPIVPL
jgi:hypothetical protein